jgi:hypothetical protein
MFLLLLSSTKLLFFDTLQLVPFNGGGFGMLFTSCDEVFDM